MTKKEIYERVVQLTEALAQTGVAKKIFSAAKEGDAVKTQKIIDDFPSEYPEINGKIQSFAEKFNQLIKTSKTKKDGEIFGTNADEKREVFEFDCNLIDALSFYALTIFGKMDDLYFFANYDEDPTSEEKLFQGVEKAGYEDLSEFIAYYSWVNWVGEDKDYKTVGELLVDAVAGNF